MTQAIVKPNTLYDTDFLLWTQETASQLKARDFVNIDLDNLIEEIESLGRSEKKELQSRLKTLLEHLLKRIYVSLPNCYGGWENTIRTQRSEIELLLIASPSLKPAWSDSFDIVWRLALKDAKGEYARQGFIFPDTWQFSRDISTMLNTDLWEEAYNSP